MAHWFQSKRGVPYGFPADFAGRLRVAQANISTNGPIEPLELYSGVRDSPSAKVRLSDVAKFALDCGWQIPDAMRMLADPVKLDAKAPQAVAVVSGEDAPAGKVWTDDRKAEARAYRDKHGLKKTAERYGVSQATISKHIPAGKPIAKSLGHWAGLDKK